MSLAGHAVVSSNPGSRCSNLRWSDKAACAFWPAHLPSHGQTPTGSGVHAAAEAAYGEPRATNNKHRGSLPRWVNAEQVSAECWSSRSWDMQMRLVVPAHSTHELQRQRLPELGAQPHHQQYVLPIPLGAQHLCQQECSQKPLPHTVLLAFLTGLLWRLLPASPRIAAPLGRGCPPGTGLPLSHILQLDVRNHIDQGALGALVAALALCRRAQMHAVSQSFCMVLFGGFPP